MTSLQPIFIAGPGAGLETDKKPFLLPDQAFQQLQNAYCWRDRVLKREGIELVGQLRRVLTAQSLGSTVGAQLSYSFANIFTTIGITGENPQLEPGSLVITIGAPDAATFTDNGNGTFTVTGEGVSAGSFVNYATGNVVIEISSSTGGGAISAALHYFPGLPTMGIMQKDIAGVNLVQNVFFDTKYAYIFSGTGFQEWIPGTTWNAQDFSFFLGANYRGSTPDIRLLFVTNFQNDTGNPMRYTDGNTWTTFQPLVSSTNTLFNAEILIPYYGRLLALNVWEGTTAGGPLAAVNIFNRCRFSQIGDPTAVDAWRSDIFGKGGFIDAPTNEEIVSAIFFKNTLIVGFERSKWQLRYVGEYGLPFIWERISSDFGDESTFSSILFDQGVLGIGDRAVTQATSTNVQRIDLQIPDIVFGFSNQNNGPERIQGVRDYQKELVYWCYPDLRSSLYKFPNKILLYNYRNGTYAQFRENVTCFGLFQSANGVTWDSTDVTWDDDQLWDSEVDQSQFPNVALGNQQGYIHIINDDILPDPSLSISGITIVDGTSVKMTILNHNLETAEFIYLTNIQYLDPIALTPIAASFNNAIFQVQFIDANTVQIFQWNGSTYVEDFPVIFTPTVDPASALFISGQATLIWELFVQTKDFNPFQAQGRQLMLSYIDFLTDATPSAVVSVELSVNSSPSTLGNLLIGNSEVETYTNGGLAITGASQANPCVITSPGHNLIDNSEIVITDVLGMTQLNNKSYTVSVIDINMFSLNGVNSTAYTPYVSGGLWSFYTGKFYVPGSQYAWHRFFATLAAQYINISMTYNDDLLNNLATHKQTWVLNALALWVRPAGKLNF